MLKQTVSTVETSQQQADQLDVLSKPKRHSLRPTQVYNVHTDSRCWTKTKKKDWDGDKSRMSRVTRGVEQHKAWKIDGDMTTTSRATRSCNKPNQSNKDWDGDKSTTSRVTRGPKQTKAKKSETEASQQRVERRELLSKTKQDLRSKSNVWALWGKLLLDWQQWRI